MSEQDNVFDERMDIGSSYLFSVSSLHCVFQCMTWNCISPFHELYFPFPKWHSIQGDTVLEERENVTCRLILTCKWFSFCGIFAKPVMIYNLVVRCVPEDSSNILIIFQKYFVLLFFEKFMATVEDQHNFRFYFSALLYSDVLCSDIFTVRLIFHWVYPPALTILKFNFKAFFFLFVFC